MSPDSREPHVADTGGESEFLAATVHELRTPLNAILGFSSTLLLRLPGPLNAEQEQQLRAIERASRYMLALVEDLLSFARAAGGLLPPARKGFVVQELVREVLELLQPLARERGLELACDLPAQPLRVRSDRRAWMQILVNLVSNGLRFTERGGVRVELARARAAGGSELRLCVTDTGRGIAPADLARLFRPYERLDPAHGSGSGLGLYLAQRLAQRLGGRIRCRSRLGSGSTFELRLPRSPR